MATYKVIQDIEAEDKLLGPLSLKQFIYAAIMAVCLYLSYLSFRHRLPFLLVLFLPVAAASAFFAFPWKLNQPTETWALAKIRFRVKNRKRIWSQSSAQDLVTITVPKHNIEKDYTNGLSEAEVSSRLNALASTIDSRGWAIKNVNLNLAEHQAPVIVGADSDRLVSAAPDQASETINNVNSANLDVQASDDILDEQNNPTAQNFERLINASNADHRRAIVDNIKQAGSGAAASPAPAAYAAASNASNGSGNWFLNQAPPDSSNNLVAPSNDDGNNGAPADNLSDPNSDEATLAKNLKARNARPKIAYGHLHTIQPLSAEPAADAPPNAAAASTNQSAASPARPNPNLARPPMATPNLSSASNRQQPTNNAVQPDSQANNDADIMNLAGNNDLDVATIARQANHKKHQATDEVVVSLH